MNAACSTQSIVLSMRNRIERFINRLKNGRRVATRYDHTATVSHNGIAKDDARRIAAGIARLPELARANRVNHKTWTRVGVHSHAGAGP
jgi:hypothetical protein